MCDIRLATITDPAVTSLMEKIKQVTVAIKS